MTHEEKVFMMYTALVAAVNVADEYLRKDYCDEVFKRAEGYVDEYEKLSKEG